MVGEKKNNQTQNKNSKKNSQVYNIHEQHSF